jgi:hypothetical protein
MYRVTCGSRKTEVVTIEEAWQERDRLAAGLPDDVVIDIEKWEDGYVGGPQWIVQE